MNIITQAVKSISQAKKNSHLTFELWLIQYNPKLIGMNLTLLIEVVIKKESI
jgi:hypothetical protein